MLFDAYRQEQSAPLFVHVLTIKGKGFTPAEQNPGEFHGVSAFDVNHLTDPDVAPDSSFSTVFGQQLAQLAGQDERICAITAAMKYGTGLQYFYKQHKARFFDVGMAEQHAVTFAAGLAANGMRPVVSIYSTFLQRGWNGSFWKTARVRCVTRAARRTKRWPLWAAAAWSTTCSVRKVPRTRRS